jgi:lysophospholipase L1-like esterase
MNHLVLLGDSIFDNGAYTLGGPAVIDHLQASLPQNWRASLLAVDGSTAADIPGQLAHLPATATHLVISAGGNDAIMQSGFVSEPARSVADVFQRITAIAEQFARDYQTMLAAVLEHALPTTLCTVYNPNFTDPVEQSLMCAGLRIFNDAILDVAIGVGLPVIDLRGVCTVPQDYANEIEPSTSGGRKIAETIVRVMSEHDFAQTRTTIYR